MLSGDNLLILDPHGKHLQDQLQSVFGNVVNTRHKHFVDICGDSPDQAAPFLSFTKHCPSVPTWSNRKHYPGTIFRLALRTQAAGSCSEISKETFNPDQMEQTLSNFMQAAPDLLLFTRHVKSISFCIKESGTDKCLLKHQCTASMSKVAAAMTTCTLQQASINIKVRYPSSSKIYSKKMWLKATLDGTRPSGSVAILLQQGSKHLPQIVGKVYSVMALPLALTSLPVHINGDFCMSSDRRTLWAGEGDRGQVRS